MINLFKNKYILFSSTLLFLIVIFIVFKYVGQNTTQPLYQQYTVQKGTLSQTISATGTVTPKNRLELKPPLAGRVEELMVQEGDLVKKGQIIGWISSADRVALIDAALAISEKELKRWQNIYKPTPLVASIDGTLISRDVEPGQTVTAADVLVVIADKLIIRATVDETDVAKVHIGEPASLTIDAYPDQEIPGSVVHVAFEATILENVTVYEVDIQPNEVPPYMKSGMSAEVLFQIEQIEDAPVIAISALQYENTQPYVYIKTSDKKYEKRFLKLGLQAENQVEIIQGLKTNDIFYTLDVSLNKSASEENENPFLPKRPGQTNKKKSSNNTKGSK